MSGFQQELFQIIEIIKIVFLKNIKFEMVMN